MDARRDVAAARSRSYWLLSRIFLEQPAAPLLRDLAGVLATAADGDGHARALGESARAALASEAALTDLQVEYTRLLGGASRASGAPEPYESVAREGRPFGASAEAVAAAYVAAGHEDLVSVTGPPDHAGTELRFLALLCYQEMQAWSAADEPEATRLLELELGFLDRHVLAWVPSLCAAIQAAATHPFYRALACLAAEACAGDRAELAQLLRAEPVEPI